MNLIKDKWIENWLLFYKTIEGKRFLKYIDNTKQNKVEVYDSKYLIQSHIAQLNRDTFTFPLLKDEYNNLNYKFKLLSQAFEKITNEVLSDKILLKKLNLTEIIPQITKQELFLFDYIRIDGFYNEETKNYKAIEINSFSPSMYLSSDLISSFTRSKNVNNITKLLAQSHIELSKLCNTSHKNINVLILYVNTEDESYIDFIKQYFPEKKLYIYKLQSINKLNKHLVIKNDILYFNGNKIDQIFLKTFRKLIKKNGLIRLSKIRAAYENRTLTLIPGLKSLIIGKKSLYPYLLNTNLIDKAGLTIAEKSILLEMIPKSFSILEVKNVSDIRINKDNWVLKYSDQSGGKGIYIGSNYSSSEWNKLLELAQYEGSTVILQERIIIPNSNLLLHQTSQTHILKKLPFTLEPFIVFLPISKGYMIAGFSARAYNGNLDNDKIKFNPSDNNKNISFGTTQIIDE